MAIRAAKRSVIVSMLGTFCGAIACIFVFIPGLTALFLMLKFLVPLDHLDASTRLVSEMLVSSLVDGAAFGVSGLLTGLIVGFFSKNMETAAALVTVLIVAVFYGVQESTLPVFEGAEVFRAYQCLELVFDTALLIGFALFAGCIVARARRLKDARASQNPHQAETE